ncbi:hypothetical protein PMG11_00015 [Penicillium brasilianum]|uniref:Uncharacterized protein n=1 Tax=Penicillium brasilianum TaxID=104259 RepID=A0A0F7TB82_PENBI|nr:hypothetical protein PMG11_00015 [Penicillium brasilianum]
MALTGSNLPESYLGKDLDEAVTMTKALVLNVKKILTVMQAVEKSTAPGKLKKKAGLENELSVYRASYLEAKARIEKAIGKLSDKERQMLVEVYKEDFTFCRLAIEGISEDVNLPNVMNTILGRNLDAAIKMVKDIMEKAKAIDPIRNTPAAAMETPHTGDDQLAVARTAYLRAKRTLEEAISELSEGEKKVLMRVYSNDLTSCQVDVD